MHPAGLYWFMLLTYAREFDKLSKMHRIYKRLSPCLLEFCCLPTLFTTISFKLCFENIVSHKNNLKISMRKVIENIRYNPQMYHAEQL